MYEGDVRELVTEKHAREVRLEQACCNVFGSMVALAKPPAHEDLVEIWRNYLHVLLTPPSSEDDPACKALVADETSMRLITMALPMSALTDYRVYDLHSLESIVESTSDAVAAAKHETAYVIVRPTAASQDLVSRLIQHDPFAAYHLAYTNRSDDAALVSLALHDTRGRGGLGKLVTVRDFFADFAPLDSHVFAPPPPHAAAPPPGLGRLSGPWRRVVADAAVAVAAALRCAALVRHQAGSAAAAELAQAINETVGGSARRVYDFPKRATVLVLDRGGDAVTPLLVPWRYEGLLHEHLPGGITANTVRVPDTRGREERFSVGATADPFLAEHAVDDYGALGDALGAAARRTLAAVEGLRNGDGGGGGDLSVTEMRRRLDAGVESNTAKGLLARHMRMFELVSDAVQRRGLLELGVLEQNIAASSEGAGAAIAAVRRAAEMAARGAASTADVQRLALLAALRFEDRAGEVCAAAGTAASVGLAALVRAALAAGGARARQEDLWGGLLGGVKRLIGAGGGPDMSAFFQHTPLLKAQLEAAADGRLDPRLYPVVGKTPDDAATAARAPATQVIVVIVGGATYAEADVVRNFNAARRRAERRSHAVLGAPIMLSTHVFLDMLRAKADDGAAQ